MQLPYFEEFNTVQPNFLNDCGLNLDFTGIHSDTGKLPGCDGGMH